MNKKKVLLLGNGLSRAFQGESWSDMIKNMSGQNNFESNLPMPLQAVYATKNNVDVAMKNLSKEMRGVVHDKTYKNTLERILEYGFTDIITTNYSYDLEIASLRDETISDYALNKMRRTTQKGKKVESNYLIHTYNEVKYAGFINRIWHIHGEARVPRSMIIGHYYYGNLLTKYKQHFDIDIQNRYYKHQKDGKGFERNSWLDSFILDDIYSIGFGLDLSEMDIWWLLDRKHREKAEHGSFHFYSPRWEQKDKDKMGLLKCYGTEIRGGEISVDENDYKGFYQAALNDIMQ